MIKCIGPYPNVHFLLSRKFEKMDKRQIFFHEIATKLAIKNQKKAITLDSMDIRAVSIANEQVDVQTS